MHSHLADLLEGLASQFHIHLTISKCSIFDPNPHFLKQNQTKSGSWQILLSVPEADTIQTVFFTFYWKQDCPKLCIVV